ncbi:MAG: PAS domain-containing protein [Flavobacteriia bacterium]|nr:PAS domain-containing protein [Flavobacteriia bacterium]
MKVYSHLSKEELVQRLRLVEQVAKTGFWNYNVNENVLRWDDQMFDIYEVDRDKFKGEFSDWENCVHKDDIKDATQSFQQSVASNGEFEYLFRINTPSGIKYIKAVAMGERDDSGEIIEMFGVNMDFTAEYQRERDTRKAAELYQVLIDQNPNATAMVDTNMVYLAASQKWLSDYNIQDQEIIGRSHYEVFPEIPNHWKDIHQECMKGVGQKNDRDKFVRADGTVQYIRWNIQPWLKANGDVGGLIMFTEDITQQVVNEEKSAEMAGFFSEAKKIARIGTWEVDLQTGLSSWDEVVADIYKTPIGWYPPTPEEGIKFYKEGKSRESILEAFGNLVETGESYDLELQLTTAEGNDIWVRSIGYPVYDDTGKMIKATGLFQDINERKLIELEKDSHLGQLKVMAERLSAQNQSLLDFAHISSHNLRSPVGNLISLSQLYNDFADEEKPDVFNKITQEITRLSSTLDDLIEALVIRESLGKFDDKVEFEEVVEKISQSLSQQINDSDFTLTTDFTACKGILSNRTYMDSIFLNLVTNALKYRKKKKPSLHISVKIEDRSVALTFKDNGIGIDLSKYNNKLFGLYNTFHRGYDSRGVGLFMVKTHVESLGGKIKVKSKIDKGTTFIIHLPADTL